MAKFGNKGKLSFAVGIADLKSFILQILILMEWNTINIRKKVFAIIIIVLDIILLIMVIRVYCFPNKRELLMRKESEEKSIKMNKNNKVKQQRKDEDVDHDSDDENDESLKEFSNYTNNWNLAIDIISVIIVVIEATASGLD